MATSAVNFDTLENSFRVLARNMLPWLFAVLVSSLAGQGVFRLNLEAGRMVSEQRLFHELGKRIRDVDVGEEGELYLLTDHNPGQLLRIDAVNTDSAPR